MKRLIFPIVNALTFTVFFAVIGYYVMDPGRWIVVGLAIGLGIGLLVEYGLGMIGGWIYRRRLTLAVLLEIVLILALIGPFVYVYALNVPNPMPVCCIEESGLGEAVEAVSIPAADGVTLEGWFAPPAEAPGPVIMVLHGGGSNRLASLSHARILHQAGYGVLVYDQRGLGESGGDRPSLGLHDQRDIPHLIDWLAARPDVDASRIGGVGLSLGAQILIMAAPDEPRLRAVWSDGLAIHGPEDVPPDYNSLGDAFITFINRQSFWIASLIYNEPVIPFRQLIPQIAPRPLMLVAGGLDMHEGNFNRHHATVLGENGTLWVIENAGHVGGLSAMPDEYTARMTGFFDDALAG